MKINSLKTFIYAAGVILVFSGCSLFSPAVNRVKYYDLDFRGKKVFEVPHRISLRNFQNISPARINFLYVGKNSTLELDQYNCWVQSPEVMLRRCMLNAVKGSDASEAKELDIAVTIFDFEFNIADSEVVLGVNCIIRDDENDRKIEKNYIIKTPVEKADRKCFVNGMNISVEKFIEQAVKDIQKF